MRKSIILIAILLITVSCSEQRKQLMIEKRIHNIENGLVQFTTPLAIFQPDSLKIKDLKTLSERMAHYKVPGVSIAVINDFKLEWAKPYGFIKYGSNNFVTTETYFQAASTSKLVTTTIVLHFVEKELLNLDENVNKYLKSWKIPGNDFTQKHKVTLRLLLTHQAGLPSTNFPQKENAGDPTLIQVLKGELPAMNKPALVEYVPGTKWQYSNLGFVVIQQILEDVVGKPFTQIAQEIVFEPLDMRHSTFLYPLNPELQVNEAIPHDIEGIVREPAMHASALAQGGLMTTPSDLAIFTIELMSAYKGLSTRLLSKEMVREMLSKELDLDPMMFGIPIGEGLGVMLYEKDENIIFLHPGSNFPGMNCWLLGDVEGGKGAIIMTNGANGEILAMEIISAIIREYYKPIAK